MVELDFTTFVQDLQDMGFYNYFLPFILVFAITFALLENSKILGDKKNVNLVVSMAIGFILIAQQPVVEIINNFLQRASLVIVVVLVALLIIFLISGKSLFENHLLGVGFILVILAIIWALSPAIGWEFPSWLNISDRTKNLVLLLLLFFVVPLLLTSSKKSTTGNWLGKALDNIGKGLGERK